MNRLIPQESLESRIFTIRGRRVLLDSDLAEVYGVTPKQLNQQFQRNRRRFPEDFAFPVSVQETKNLRSQIVTSSWGGRRYRPTVFTEQGAVMLASVLNSSKAVRAGIQVVRAFIRLRQMLGAHTDLARKLADLEARYDAQFKVVFEAIRALMDPPEPEAARDRIGFHRA